jgi:hypothetical protein
MLHFSYKLIRSEGITFFPFKSMFPLSIMHKLLAIVASILDDPMA